MIHNGRDNHLFLITREVIYVAIRAWINTQRNPYFFGTVLHDNKRFVIY